MFQTFGTLVSRTWPLLLVAWLAVLVGLKLVAPPWHEVAVDGEFAFLPKDSASLVGEELFRKAWDEPVASNVVIVVRRESSPAGLLDSDRVFIDEVLRPKLEALADEATRLLHEQAVLQAQRKKLAEGDESAAEAEFETVTVRTFSDQSIGRLLNSDDGQASLVLVELPTEFLDARNAWMVERIEKLIGRNGELPTTGVVPPGLDLALSGSATVGRDMIRAATESSRDTELWTVILVVLLLLAIYRAPKMALIPLITVAIATEISLALLACLAKAEVVNLFAGIEVYVKVLSYGAGVDYSLFLMARYKEELDEGKTLDQAVANSLAKVGHTLVASAGTVICGIGMMVFAEFGKFRQAGVAITVGLIIVLFAALTFSPALLRFAQRCSFRPHAGAKNLSRRSGWVSATSLWSRLMERNWGQLFWNRVGELVRCRPGTVLLVSFFVMLPLAGVGVRFHGHLSYGLLSELPRDTTCVVGAEAVARHFPPGIAGPITVLLKSETNSFLNEDDGLLTAEARQLVQSLTDHLREHRDTLQLADMRTLLHPFGGGLTAVANGETAQPDEPSSSSNEGIGLSLADRLRQAVANRHKSARTTQHYISSRGDLKDHVLRLDLVLQDDPFTRGSIAQFDLIRRSVEQSVPTGLKVFSLGPTASLSDLKRVTDRDQIRIDMLVLGGVFLILIVLLTHTSVKALVSALVSKSGVSSALIDLLSRFAISVYLVVSVFFSYLVTLGVTFAAFWAIAPGGFEGLDWKVPIFLFTILIAVGEDYNIFLITRIDEEQSLHGPVAGVISALQKTGSIISSCGIIMAGTFCSLLAGSLVGLHQLGFALAFGVLLDTFVVRPILVPAFLVLLYAGRLTSLNRLLARSKRLSEKPVA